MRVLGVVVGCMPVAFGLLRLATTRVDVRYLVLAFASAVAAGLTLAITRQVRTPLRVVIVLIGTALVGVAVGLLQGATSIPAVAFVATGFAVCHTLGLWLFTTAQS